MGPDVYMRVCGARVAHVLLSARHLEARATRCKAAAQSACWNRALPESVCLRAGLAAAVISKDRARCQRLTAAFRCGIVWVNCSQPCFVQSSWGGVKRSGYGRDLGEAGLEKYLSLKAVTEYVSPNLWDWYPQQSTPSKL